MKKIQLTFIFMLSSLMSTIVLSAPPGYAVKQLFLKAGNGTNQTSIYANGLMQAKVNVYYELAEGESLKKIELKELYTESSIPDFTISNLQDKRFSNDIVHSNTSTSTSTKTTSYTSKYLTTNKVASQAVCAVLTTVSGHTSSTCQNNTNSAYVQINAKEKITYTIRDWRLIEHERLYPSFSQSGESWVRQYAPPTGFIISYVDYNGATDYRVPKNARLVFASPTYNPDVTRDGQSTLYVYKPNTGITSNKIPYRFHNPHKMDTYTINKTFNTNQALTFITTYMYTKYGEYVYLNNLGGSTYYKSHIDIYDTYGNKTRVHLVRDKLQIKIQ